MLVFGATLQDGLDNCIVNILYIATGIDHDWRGNISAEVAYASDLAEVKEVKVE